jgi:hypothetical protein
MRGGLVKDENGPFRSDSQIILLNQEIKRQLSLFGK